MLQVIVNVIDFHMPIAEAVSAPRLHHQWQPDEVFAEPDFAPDLLDALKARGHTIVPTRPFTSANSIEVTTERAMSAPPTPAPAAPWRRGIVFFILRPAAVCAAASAGTFARNWLANRSSEGAKIGAGEGIRTLDPDLGKVVLYP